MPSPPATPSQRLRFVQEQLTAAAERVGRDPSSVTLVGVSKGHPSSSIRAFVEAGLTDVGESYLQEAEGKFGELTDLSFRRHFIGALQRNKVKRVLPLVDLLQSVDSVKLAREVVKRVRTFHGPDSPSTLPKPYPCMVQVNLAGEESKHGCFPALTSSVAEVLTDQSDGLVSCVGLMTIAPLSTMDDPVAQRSFFNQMARHWSEVRDQFPECVELSMGMSGSFPVAVEEGATLVRVGSLLFGPRPISDP